MRKKMIRTVSVLLCLAMLCCVSAYAIELRASEQIKSYSATLARKSNGDLNLTFSITTNGTMSTIGLSSVEIQRSSSSGWISEYTYTASNTPSLQGSNRSVYQNFLTHTPDYPESSYRAIVTFYVKNDSGSTTRQLTTNIV